jgi:hypothetical protein
MNPSAVYAASLPNYGQTIAWHDIAICPVQFQQFIPGTNFRVHIVGEELFTARIDSEAEVLVASHASSDRWSRR